MARTSQNTKDMTSNTALGTNPNVPNINTGVTPVAPSTPTIPVTGLTTPVAPINVPPVPTTPTTGVLGDAITSAASGFTSDAETTANKNALTESLNKIIGNIEGQGSTIADITKAEDLTTKDAAKRKATADLAAIDKAYLDEVAQIKENKQGKFGGAVAQDIQKATDAYNNRRANSVIQANYALGDYQAALDTVNLKVNALKDQTTQSIQAYQLLSSSVMNDLTDSEKLQVQANLDKKKSDAELINTAYSSALTTAVKNGAPASILSAIDAAAKAPGATAGTILAAAGRYGAEREDAKTQVVELSDGTKQLINTQTGSIIATYGKGTDTGATSEQLLLVNDINNLLADPNIDSVFGLQNFVGRTIPGTPAYTLTSQVNNIIQQAALAQRGKLKGQGAVSDFEGKMLREAVTALKLNQNPDDAKKALTKLKGAVTTSSGGSAQVMITDKDGNSKLGLADQEMIMEAISSGYRVEYQ